MKSLGIATLVIGFLLGSAGAAAASYDPVGGGATTVELSGSFRQALRANGVRLVAEDGARIEGGRASFPVVGGRLDPLTGRGLVEHTGSLVFVAGRKRLPLRGLIFKASQRQSPLSAKFGGGKLKIAASARLVTARDGFGFRAKARSMKLSAKVATRLGKKLDKKAVFFGGQALGSAVTVVRPAAVAMLPKGQATFTPSQDFLAKLRELFVSVNPVAPAQLGAGPTFTLPIAGGALAPDVSSGFLTTGGSLEFLQLGAGQIFWTETSFDFLADRVSAEVEFGPVPQFPGKLGRLDVLALTGGSTSSDPISRSISGGQQLTMSAATAAAFNEAFAKPQEREGVFVEGELVGDLSFAGQAQ